MSAYLTRMPAGIPGDVSRKEGATIESSLVGSKTIPYGAFVKLVSGKLEPLAASDTAAVIYGLAVRPYPKQSDAVGFGVASAPAGSLCDVLRSGYMTVKLASGTAARGGQVYYMHNRVETIDRCAATLKKLLGDDVAIGVAHGKMDEKGLSSVMQQLSDGEIQVLVCTTIIETGIDIPNVNTLIIEDADRLGLAQLHQIRGRIGRSARRAYAYMTYRAGKILTEVAAKRLTAIREYAEFGSGFRIAMRDLEIRGAGNLLGPEQSGYMMSVGYDMYLQLLEEAVLEQRGEKAPQRTECSADLTVSANLPESYIPSGEQRMDIYRRIAALRTAEQSQELLDELIDRYGEPPQPVLKLMDVALLRAEAVQIGVSDISQRGSEITFTFAASEAVPVEAVMALCSLPKNRRRLTLSATGTEPKLLLRLSLGEDALDTALTLVGDLRVNKEENEKEVTL